MADIDDDFPPVLVRGDRVQIINTEINDALKGEVLIVDDETIVVRMDGGKSLWAFKKDTWHSHTGHYEIKSKIE